jgi:Bifunctional DNA primase/polymerase, N-terminal/Primase C terminal 1 (PriCT-1)
LTNKRNRITALDVDTADERVFADALTRHGDTPIKVRTASGKFHAWYAYNGERRRIRPFEGLPIDLLGDGGLIVAPPAQTNKGSYDFIDGGLDDLDRLPTMHGLSPEMYKAPVAVCPAPGETIREGHRNDSLWAYCMRQVRHCDDMEALLDVARMRNSEFMPPLPDAEVIEVAKSAWAYEQNGRNRFGRTGAWLPTSELNRLIAEPDVFTLLMFLKANNGPDAEFMIANGLAEGDNAKLAMSRKGLARARQRLLQLGYVYQVRAAGGWAQLPALYRWPKRPGGEGVC